MSEKSPLANFTESNQMQAYFCDNNFVLKKCLKLHNVNISFYF